MRNLPHENWCDFGTLHRDCCHRNDEFARCSCLTYDILERLAAIGSLRVVADDD